MEHEIRSRYGEHILHEALRRYGIAPEHCTLLDGFESFIYEFTRDDGHYILRIGHSLRRTPDLIQGEVEWINYLAAGGAGVAQAIHSQTGALVERIDDGHGGQFLATAFVRAPGGPIWENGGWSLDRYERYGALIGRIHALSRTYTPTWKRPEWDDPSNLDGLRWLPPSESHAENRFRQVLAYLHTLPRDAASYGLIHQDAHSNNFFVDETETLTLFDFDDCVYGWYVYDIAMVVFYRAILHPDPAGLMAEFMPAFWRGYRREYDLDPAWLAEIPPFLKLREIDLYAVIHRSFEDVHDIDDDWVKAFMQGRKARIEEDAPVVDFDFAAFGQRVG